MVLVERRNFSKTCCLSAGEVRALDGVSQE